MEVGFGMSKLEVFGHRVLFIAVNVGSWYKIMIICKYISTTLFHPTTFLRIDIHINLIAYQYLLSIFSF